MLPIGPVLGAFLSGLCELGKAAYEDIKPVVEYYSKEATFIENTTSEEFLGFAAKMLPPPDAAPGQLWKNVPGKADDYNNDNEIDISVMRPFEELAGQSVLWTLLTSPVTISASPLYDCNKTSVENSIQEVDVIDDDIIEIRDGDCDPEEFSCE